ncbi:hypothetical protein [Xenorhabdus sp. PB62.4]|uniref:hypothetical protein n=1 Tax=Xenorhabdus sp. PB62.4 TaxID=1851573 RepID=UPI001656D0B1|nr:hypothetical protein [Xenorhabdus sp. PB62.4]
MKISKIKILFIMIFLIALVFSGSYYAYMKKYQMAMLVPSYDENSLEYPSKKVWFDASEWSCIQSVALL